MEPLCSQAELDLVRATMEREVALAIAGCDGQLEEELRTVAQSAREAFSAACLLHTALTTAGRPQLQTVAAQEVRETWGNCQAALRDNERARFALRCVTPQFPLGLGELTAASAHELAAAFVMLMSFHCHPPFEGPPASRDPLLCGNSTGKKRLFREFEKLQDEYEEDTKCYAILAARYPHLKRNTIKDYVNKGRHLSESS
jgi:hypothetical protein